MLQYLVILLDDTSVAYCHADNPLKEHNLMPIETLKKGILFGMKQNLMIQYVFPSYTLPEEYFPVIESIDNVKIYPLGTKPKTEFDDKSETDVVVATVIPAKVEAKNIVLRLTFSEVLKNKNEITKLFAHGQRINLFITDLEQFTDERIEAYKQMLSEWNEALLALYIKGQSPQFNLLTDRIVLGKMHNCESGVNNITLAPNGKFYICPAFYYENEEDSIGDLEHGLDIKNSQLYKLEYAPICRHCDAYQCKRCIWLNRKTTLEVNTPSHEQCVVAHLERNASRELLENIRKHGMFMPEIEIKEIDYLDPFDKREQW